MRILVCTLRRRIIIIMGRQRMIHDARYIMIRGIGAFSNPKRSRAEPRVSYSKGSIHHESYIVDVGMLQSSSPESPRWR
jgi:hypothetical protein